MAQCEQTTYNIIEVCPAATTDDRRYLGMMYDDDNGKPRTHGVYNPNCNDHRLMKSEGFLPRCLVCLCTCATIDHKLDRYFSLQDVVSNTVQGMVVTGVRLVNYDNVFYIEVQQGLLKENGTIANTEDVKPQWVNAKRIDIGSRHKDFFYRYPPKDYTDFKTNDEIYAVHWGQKTALLDDYVVDEDGDYVLTGLRFQRSNDKLMLQIRVNAFDYKTGKFLGEGIWKPLQNPSTTGRTRIRFNNADDPIKKARTEGHAINPNPLTFVRFEVTQSEADMGQNTVPFIDMQEVVTNPPTPLAGAGLYHKGTANGDSGGFLGLKVTQYDFTKHL